MKNCFEKSKKDGSIFKDVALPICFFVGILLFFYIGLNSITKTTSEEQFKATKQAVTRSAVHCYAIEGAYPSNIDYLKERYGLTIDESKYMVDYNCFASNLMPDITVLKITQ